MRIENIDKAKLSKAPDKELLILRLRFLQLWSKAFMDNKKAIVGSLNRNDFLSKYRLLLKEYNNRKLEHSTEAIDRAAFKKAMEIAKAGLDVSALGDVVVVPDYVSVSGSFVRKSPEEAGDIDIILREDEENRDENLELKLSRAIQGQIQKDVHFVYAPKGSHSSYIPAFDLVLRAKEETKKVEVKEDYQKSAKDYYEGLDAWSDDFEADYRELTKHLVGDTILSLGCGSGRIEQRLSEIYKVEGIDNNEIALKFCKDKKLKVRKVDLEKEKLPYEDSSFDNVIGVHLLEHIKNRKQLLKEMQRIAKRRIIIIVPLGKRLDKTHQVCYDNLDSFRKEIEE